eukprot:204691_1
MDFYLNSYLQKKKKSEFIEHSKDDKFPLLVFGNKCDLDEQRNISRLRGENWAKQRQNTLFYEISAKDENYTDIIANCMLELTKKCIFKDEIDKNIDPPQLEETFSIDDTKRNE